VYIFYEQDGDLDRRVFVSSNFVQELQNTETNLVIDFIGMGFHPFGYRCGEIICLAGQAL
jgi:hypothetical protein